MKQLTRHVPIPGASDAMKMAHYKLTIIIIINIIIIIIIIINSSV